MGRADVPVKALVEKIDRGLDGLILDRGRVLDQPRLDVVSPPRAGRSNALIVSAIVDRLVSESPMSVTAVQQRIEMDRRTISQSRSRTMLMSACG